MNWLFKFFGRELLLDLAEVLVDDLTKGLEADIDERFPDPDENAAVKALFALAKERARAAAASRL